MSVDTIGGFPIVNDNCLGCGNRLLIGNAWMVDGCPCNTPLGVNSMNETRWRLLMQLQQMTLNDVNTLERYKRIQELELLGWKCRAEAAEAIIAETM